MNEKYFLDTYAIFEILAGNKAYLKYKKSPAATTIFNLAELNYNLKKEFDKKTANKITRQYASALEETTISDIEKAMDLKTKKRKASIPDTIGYIAAKRVGARFLTGDAMFEGMPNVEFVK